MATTINYKTVNGQVSRSMRHDAERAPVVGASAITGGSDTAPVRVAIVSDAAIARNGVGTYYSDLVAQLIERCEDIRLICPDEVATGWYRYVGLPMPGDTTQKVFLPTPGQLSTLRRMKPTVIVVPTPGPFGLAGLWMARRLKIPLICGFHTNYQALADIYWRSGLGRISQGYLNWCNRLIFSHSALVLGNSPEMVELARQAGATRAELMGTSVAPGFLASKRVALPGKPGKRSFLFAGRLAAEKNLSAVLDCAQVLPQASFTIAGDGPLRETVETACQHLANLDYVGWLPRERLADVVDRHDALILPSHVESFGTVALEAMARGRPVVLSSRCGISQWPELSVGLFAMEQGRPLSSTLQRFLSMPESTLEQMSHQSFEAARAHNRLTLSQWSGWLTEMSSTRRDVG